MSRTRTGHRTQSGTPTNTLNILLHHYGDLNGTLQTLGGREDLGPSGRALLQQTAERLARQAKPGSINSLLRQAGEGWLRQTVEDTLLARGSRDIDEKLAAGAHMTSTLLELHRRSGIRDRLVVRRLLAQDDTPPHLERQLAEEAVLRGVKLRTERCEYRHHTRVSSRMSEQLAAELERLQAQLGVPVTAETLADPRVRVLAARLVRHARNLASMPAGAEGRRRRAETLFERSWQNACATIAPALQAEHEEQERAAAEAEREWEEWRRKRGIVWAADEDEDPEEGEDDDPEEDEDDDPHVGTAEEALSDSGRKCGAEEGPGRPGQEEAGPEPHDEAAQHAGTTEERLRDPGRCCEACDERSTPAPQVSGPAGWVDDMVVQARRGRPQRRWCDLQGRVAWADGRLLAETLRRHEELPDQILAGIKRASAWHDGHTDPNVPLKPAVLLDSMGPQGVATLLRRLRTVRTQWPENHRPPRYIRNPRSSVEWRTAARFLVKNGSEAEWLLQTEEGEDMLPAAARCALLLGPEVLAERTIEQTHEMLAAAAGWDIDTLEGTFAAMRNARGMSPLDYAAVLLSGDLTDGELKIALRLSDSWNGSATDLIATAKVLY